MIRFAVIIPTLNAGTRFELLLRSIAEQTVQPCRKIVLDSSSADMTPALARQFGFEVLSIEKAQFNHGATRQKGVELVPEQDFLLFLTQDAILAHPEAFENILATFVKKEVGAAYGRQLPHHTAGPLGAHARIFNYPSSSRIKSLSDKDALGIKTAFISNSFAVYRRTALASVDGFPQDVILGEDTFAAAKMLLSGWEIAYCAEAKVYHSHDYSCLQESKRYFDTGAFHASQPWIRQSFGSAEGEGLRFVKSELYFLYSNGYKRYIPLALINTAFKFIAYKIGLWLK